MIENTISSDGGASSYVLLLWAGELHGRGVRGTVVLGLADTITQCMTCAREPSYFVAFLC